MTEAAFLEFALNYLQRQTVACFLDSAGPLHARSERMILSGAPAGLFLQRGTSFEYHPTDGTKPEALDWKSFEHWLLDFQKTGFQPGGPLLFPLLSYEAFSETQRAGKHHPIWPDVDGIWLLTKNSFEYHRPTQRFTAPPDFPENGSATFPEPPASSNQSAAFGWREDPASYAAKIRQVKHDIFEGNYYQANLSSRFYGTTSQQPLETYKRMRSMNPSPFMGIYRWDDLWILSGSPERLLAQNGNMLSTRPIAGTQPRLTDPEADAASILKLTTSPKERAEHLMLVDLARNDLGKIAKPGSVRVPEFAAVESYSHVHHLVSQVEAQIRPGVSALDAIAALFPCGTITGAPKIACMQRLAQLEGEARGPYTGAFGYLDGQGNMDLNILIRTLIQRDRHICFHAGGGIVADSQHQAEFSETRHKAAALMEALALGS